jgi:p70 ribosomal S6 kinase
MEVERMMLEEHARFYLSQIVCALEYLHSIDIVYRDLKTENVMLDEAGHVKLIDFGLSKLNMNEGALTNTFCGTVEYMAPEVVTRSPGYSKPADWWSFGIFTFDLLTGRSPFHSNRGKQETKERILRGKFHTPAFLTPQAQDMIRRLLRRPVDRRLGSKDGAIEIKSHDFFNGICWDKVLKRDYEPPFVPILSSEDDVSNFDTRFTSKSPRESDDMGGRNGNNSAQEPEQAPEQHMFKDFDWISPELLSSHLESSSDKSRQVPSQQPNTDNGASNLTDEIQDLRIRGYGD